MKILTYIALKGIRFYQLYISPYKGFSCSFRVLTKGSSCSNYGAKVIKRFGVFTGYKLLKRRFSECGWASQILREKHIAKKDNQGSYLGSKLRHQRGAIDCPDSDCLDALDCCDIFDCGKKSDRKRDRRNNI